MSRYLGAVPSLLAGLILAVAPGPTLADVDIDWVTALRIFYTAQVVYERCDFHSSWEELSALSEGIDDAEREAALPSSVRVSMKREIENEASSDKSAFCENGRRIVSPGSE